jgi:prepilin-type N-terminal cleavage/methylation domain-containing protein
MRTPPALRIAARRAGFTLVEVLAVIVILAILAAFLYSNFASSIRTTERKATEILIGTIGAALDAVANEDGDYPPSVFPAADVPDGGGTNCGIENVYAALWSGGRNGFEIDTEHLLNTDGDQSRKDLTDLPTRDLFELVDRWENPIAYFHHRDYGDQHVYLTMDPKTGEELENSVRARRDPKTKDWYERRGFQLLSAGPDGRFGTDDDIANFKFE